MIALSILIVPYLWALSSFLEADGFVEGSLVMQIGIRAAFISLVFLWCSFMIFKKMHKRKISAAAITVLLAIPTYIVINVSIAKFTSEPMINVWGIMSYGIMVVIAGILFSVDYGVQKRKENIHI